MIQRLRLVVWMQNILYWITKYQATLILAYDLFCKYHEDCKNC
jgi:hypothetical protein